MFTLKNRNKLAYQTILELALIGCNTLINITEDLTARKIAEDEKEKLEALYHQELKKAL